MYLNSVTKLLNISTDSSLAHGDFPGPTEDFRATSKLSVVCGGKMCDKNIFL